MSTIFIIHGVGGNSEENWFPWLKKELEALGHKVIVPNFPTPKDQTLSHWLKTMSQYEKHIDKDTIFIGHSLGVPFILTLLEKHPVKAAFLVAGFVGKVENKFDDSMTTFAQKQFDWQKITANCKTFTIFHSDNDQYIKLEKAQELANLLKTKVTIIKRAGHFNKSSGYNTFEILLKAVQS